MRLALSLGLLLSLAGCAAQLVDTSRLQYMASEFTAESLHAEGLATLPVVAGGGQEGLRRPLASKLEAYLGEALPEGRYLTTTATMDAINNADLSQSYSRLIEDYDRTAVLNKASLQEIGKATSTRYLMFVKLLGQSESRGMKVGVMTRGVVNTESNYVNIFGQIWDTKLGDVSWEAVGEVLVESGEMTYIEGTLDDFVDYATCAYLNYLPGVKIPLPKEKVGLYARGRKRERKRAAQNRYAPD